jgi:pyruvate,water dikinase
VPDGFHVTTEAYRQFVEENDLQPRILAVLQHVDHTQPATLDVASMMIGEMFDQAEMPHAIAGAIAQAYASLAGQSPYVAVRSSATAEDLPSLSFAGQQDTYLNVRGAADVLAAVRRCWASLWTARAIGYRARNGIDQSSVRLAVVVQLLVPAEAAGILFTADPVTGVRDHATISASWGLGEAVVGGLVTPDSLTVDKVTGSVLERRTADKVVMTVRVDGGTEERPVPAELRSAPVLDDEQAGELVRLGVQIEELYKRPMDIEWTLLDGTFAIVQARPITVLPEPEAAAPTDWPLPDPKGRYMRTSIIDLMPDPLTPLFATMGLSAINRSLRGLVEVVFDAPAAALPEDTIVTINGYAYMIVSFTPKQWWLMLSRLVPAFPRMLREGVPYWRDVAHPQYAQEVGRWRAKSPPDLSASELLAGARSLMDVAAVHLGSLMASTMGPSAGSEGLFTRVYERLIKRPDDPSTLTFLLGFDSIPLQSEKALYDLAQWCQPRASLAQYLLGATSDEILVRIRDGRTPRGPGEDDWHEFQRRIEEYLDSYGYSIFTLDFAKRLPVDDPGPQVEMLRHFIAGEGKNPYERQRASAERREAAVKGIRGRLKGIKRWAFEKSYGWASSLVPLREDGIAEIGLGYPVLRRMLQELGRRFVAEGAIAELDDVFWLEADEVEQAVAALEKGSPLLDCRDQVAERKAVWRAAKRVAPPPQMPAMEKFMGIRVDSYTAVSADDQTGGTLKGVGTSPGRVTAPARVLHGPEDFDRMQSGDILVAGITTPAWTPLFAVAAGVVTDVGGPLSHGSIVAREYGIPAVMGTGVATKRIEDGQAITIDGSQGVVVLEALAS